MAWYNHLNPFSDDGVLSNQNMGNLVGGRGWLPGTSIPSPLSVGRGALGNFIGQHESLQTPWLPHTNMRSPLQVLGGWSGNADRLKVGGGGGYTAPQEPRLPNPALAGGALAAYRNALSSPSGGGVNSGRLSALAAALVNAQMGPLAIQEAQARAQATQDIGRGRSITGAQKRSAQQTMRQQQALTNQSLASAAQQAADTEEQRNAASSFLDQALADRGGGPYTGGPTAAEVAGGSAAAGGARRAADMGAGFREFAAAARDVAQTGGSEFARDVLGRRSQSLAELAMQRNQVRAQQPQIFMELLQNAQANADRQRASELERLKALYGLEQEGMGGMTPQDIAEFASQTHGVPGWIPNPGDATKPHFYEQQEPTINNWGQFTQGLMAQGVPQDQAAYYAQFYGHPNPQWQTQQLAHQAQNLVGGLFG